MELLNMEAIVPNLEAIVPEAESSLPKDSTSEVILLDNTGDPDNHHVTDDSRAPTREDVESAIKAFLRQHSRRKVQSATISKAILGCKLDTADDSDRRELIRIIESLPPGSIKGNKASLAKNALIRQYNRWRENKYRVGIVIPSEVRSDQ